jgi:hypothetical protein
VIDSNTLYTASNIMVQAGYTIKNVPLPADYSALGTSILQVGLDILGLIAIIGRIIHGWKNESSIVRGLLLGDNTPKAVLKSRIAPVTTTTITQTQTK